MEGRRELSVLLLHLFRKSKIISNENRRPGVECCTVRWVASPVPRCLAEGAWPQLPPADRRPEFLLSKEEVPHPFLFRWSTDRESGRHQASSARAGGKGERGRLIKKPVSFDK